MFKRQPINVSVSHRCFSPFFSFSLLLCLKLIRMSLSEDKNNNSKNWQKEVVSHIRNSKAVAGWLSSLEGWAKDQKFTSLIPGQGICIAYGFDPQLGWVQGATDWRSLSHPCLSISLSKINKNILGWGLKKRETATITHYASISRSAVKHQLQFFAYLQAMERALGQDSRAFPHPAGGLRSSLVPLDFSVPT